MNIRVLWRIVAGTVVFLVIYFAVPYHHLSSHADECIRLSTIKWVAQRTRVIAELCYVSMLSTENGRDIFADPSSNALMYLNNAHIPCAPRSQAKRGKTMKEYPECDLPMTASGQPAMFLGANTPRRLSFGLAICTGYQYHNPLSAGRYRLILLRTPWGWVPLFPIFIVVS